MRTSISERVLGITDPTNHPLAIEQACLTLTGEPLESAMQLMHYPDSIFRMQALRHVVDAVVTRDVRSADSFVDWPDYQRTMDQHGEKADGSASALMVGALTSLSARSFVCLAEDVYGADKAFIIDPEVDRDKIRHGLFVQASGLQLPFPSESMDFVHTNRLLYKLEDPMSPSRPLWQRIRMLGAEVARVLAPGGQALMQETILNHNQHKTREQSARAGNKLGADFCRILRQHGVELARHEIARHIPDISFLFDRDRDFNKYPSEENPLATMIYARKRPRSMFALDGRH